MSQLFASGGQSVGASASPTVLPMNIQGWFLLGLTALISLLTRDSQESSLAPQFESVNSSALSLLFGPSLNLYMITGKGIVSTLQICHSFPSKEQVSFNVMAAVTILSDFGAQEKKICHCFHFSPFYLPRSEETRRYDLSVSNVHF